MIKVESLKVDRSSITNHTVLQSKIKGRRFITLLQS